MQKDSPGRLTKERNERYNPGAHPKLLSLSSAKKKAAEFAAKDDKVVRVGAKKAILQELNSHLAIRAQGIFPREHSENPYGKQAVDKRALSHPKHASAPQRGRKAKGKVKGVIHTEGRKQAKEAEYNWNKHGRQQELRIRCLARKFVFLWIINVYGRVHPHVARNHYYNNVTRHVLQVWQDIWWSGRKGWKLNIRAEYHNRCRIWLKVWKAWRAYVMQERIKKDKDKMAFQCANIKLQGTHFKVWIKYTKTRRSKRKKTAMAYQLAVTFTIRLAFHQWMNQLEAKREHRAMEHTAMQYWAYTLLVKCWSAWTSALSIQLIQKAKLSYAKKISNGKLLIKVWIGWMNYRATRKLKAIQKRVADKHYNATSVTKALKTWNARLHRKKHIAQFEDLITNMGSTARARRAVVHWNFYITLQHRKYAKQTLATVHYERHLKRTVFDILHLQLVLRRLKNMRNKMSKDFWYKLQLKRMWTVWLKRCEHSEELKIYPLTRKARNYYRVKLLHKAIHSWQLYCRWRQHRKQQYYVADRHYIYHALPRYFGRIVIFVQMMKDRNEDRLAANQFKREVLLAKTFYKWQHEYKLLLDLQMMNRMAILHHDEVTKRHYITTWLSRTRTQLQDHQLQAQADDHNSYRLLDTALQEWKIFTRNAKTCRCHHHAAVRHRYLCVMKRIWASWTKYVQHRQLKWRKQTIADLHYQQRITRKLLHGWKNYCACSLHAMSVVNQRLKHHENKRLRELFSTWRHFATQHQNSRVSRDQATILYQTTIKRKLFATWRYCTYLHALKAEEMFISVQEKRTALNQGKLRRALRAWFVATQDSLHEKSLLYRSDQHYRKVLLHKTVDGWKSYVRLCFRIKILCRQSMWLHNHRITYTFLRRWRQQFAVSLETKRKTSLSLWHWSVNLQRKALQGWLMYAISKKQKKERIAQALQLRRTRLFKTGATQWIKVAFQLSSERSRYSQVRHVEQARRLHQYVYKCAMHWRRWANRRISQRGKQPQQQHAIQGTRRYESKHQPGVEFPSGTSRRAVSGSLPDLFKDRPKPRVPDYLRESFDVSTISTDTDNAPISSLNYNLVPMASDNDNDRRYMGAEEVPRPGPPSPCLKPAVHPLRRSPGHDSIAFLPSSEGEGESFVAHSEQKRGIESTVSRQQPLVNRAQPITIPIMRKPTTQVLLPPSSFQSLRQTTTQKDQTVDKEGVMSKPGEVSLDQNSPNTTKDSFSPQSSDHSIIHSNASSPDSTDGEEHSSPRPVSRHINIQAQILDAKKQLQEHYDLKLQYRTVKRQRDELQKAIHNQGDDAQDADAQQLLAQLTEATHELLIKIRRNRPLVEDLAININKMIEKIG